MAATRVPPALASTAAARHAFAPPPAPAVPVRGGGGLRLPVRRIYCVGRNYPGHAAEMGGDPAREPPFFFSKPADAVVAVAVADGDDERPGRPRALPYPLATGCVHPEVELVVALGGRESGGANIPRGEAMRHVYGFAVGVDLTRRDLQEAAKRAGRPWDCAKGFDGSAPVGDIVERGLLGVTDGDTGLGDRPIWLDVDGDRRQAGTLDQMVWSIPEIISHLSTLFVLRPGDLIFTGTPSGVGPVERGQVVTAGIEGVGRLRFVFE